MFYTKEAKQRVKDLESKVAQLSENVAKLMYALELSKIPRGEVQNIAVGSSVSTNQPAITITELKEVPPPQPPAKKTMLYSNKGWRGYLNLTELNIKPKYVIHSRHILEDKEGNLYKMRLVNGVYGLEVIKAISEDLIAGQFLISFSIDLKVVQ